VSAPACSTGPTLFVVSSGIVDCPLSSTGTDIYKDVSVFHFDGEGF
jgi:hypothetical protein